MTDSTDLQTQLTEIAVELTGKVAEMLAYAARDMEPSKREKIYEMLEESLPTVVTNTLFRTTVLHSAKGIDHLKANMETYAQQFAQSIIKNDM
jgi:hypothetical protein